MLRVAAAAAGRTAGLAGTLSLPATSSAAVAMALRGHPHAGCCMAAVAAAASTAGVRPRWMAADAAAGDGGGTPGGEAAPRNDYGVSVDVDAGDADKVRRQVDADALREAEDNPAKDPADVEAEAGEDGDVYGGASPGKQ